MSIARLALCVTTCLSLASSVRAAPASSPAATRDDRMRTVILGLQARRGVDDKQLAAALTDVVQGVYATDATRIVIGKDDISRVLELEAGKQAAGCDSDKCLAEVGQALDASRIVAGTLDKIGDGYMVTMSEIDAKSLEALGRVQERTPSLSEDVLVQTVTKLAQQLLGKAPKGQATAVVGNAGSVDIETDPRGAAIQLSGADLGVTPSKIDNIATGTHKLRLVRTDYEPVDVEVPVFAGGTTKVSAQLRILRPLAEKNLEIRRAHWRDASQTNQLVGWSKAVGGGVVAAGGGLLGVAAIANGDALLGTGLVVAGAVGGGVLAWGVIDLLNPPAEPIPEWEVERKVTVAPPKGKGDEQVHVLQKAPETHATER